MYLSMTPPNLLLSTATASEGVQVLSSARCLLWGATVFCRDGHFYWELDPIDETAAQRFLPVTIHPGEDYASAWFRAQFPEDIPRLDENAQRALRTGQLLYSQEFRCRDLTGQLRWLYEDVFVQPVAGNQWRLVGVCTDMTAQKHLQVQLAQSEARYRTLFEESMDAIYITERGGVFVDANPAMVALFGYTREEIIVLNVSDIYVCPSDCLRFQKTIEKTGAVRDYEVKLRKKDGSEMDCLLTATVRRDSDGRIVGYQGIVRDLTAQKRAEALATLQQQALCETNKMASLGVLVAGLAHEINNPNNFIQLNAQALARVWDEVLPVLDAHSQKESDFVLANLPYEVMRAEVGQLISEITAGTKRIGRMVEQLKHFARRDAGEWHQEVAINSVVESALVVVNSLIRKSTHRFSVELGVNLPLIRGNAQQLEQVLINLIQNACEALSVRGAQKDSGNDLSITTAYSPEKDSVLVTVRDSGCGIAQKDLPHLFEPFFTTKRETGGMGLGLFVSYRMVKNHGGEMSFTSTPGKGTTASVTLPVRR